MEELKFHYIPQGETDMIYKDYDNNAVDNNSAIINLKLSFTQ